MRVEHWQNAQSQGKVAAAVLLGDDVAYDELPSFFSDQYDAGLEYFGHVGREGAEVRTDIDPAVAVTDVTQEALLRVTREAIINAVRHGHAGTVRVELRSGPLLQLAVIDDGAGFDVERAMATPGRMGLRSMKARISGIGGRLEIRSAPGQGTQVTVTLP